MRTMVYSIKTCDRGSIYLLIEMTASVDFFGKYSEPEGQRNLCYLKPDQALES